MLHPTEPSTALPPCRRPNDNFPRRCGRIRRGKRTAVSVPLLFLLLPFEPLSGTTAAFSPSQRFRSTRKRIPSPAFSPFGTVPSMTTTRGGGVSREMSQKSSPETDRRAPLRSPSRRTRKYDLDLLLIDNYDSYTYNLYQYLAEMCLTPPRVISNDDELPLNGEGRDGIVLSPGPGNPSTPKDVGICRDAVLRCSGETPILGVCLGHQLIAHLFDGEVGSAPTPMHGLTSSVSVTRRDHALFRHMPESFEVVRYHSLSVSELGEELEVLAVSKDDGVIMALGHKERPLFGVQFHPESVGSEYGKDILRNFCEVCETEKEKKRGRVLVNDDKKYRVLPSWIDTTSRVSAASTVIPSASWSKNKKEKDDSVRESPYRILVNEPVSVPDVSTFDMFSALDANQNQNSFWLDSSSSGISSHRNARFSIMGNDDGPLCRLVHYYGAEHHPSVRGLRVLKKDDDGKWVEDTPTPDSKEHDNILDYLQVQLQSQQSDDFEMVRDGVRADVQSGSGDLPFDYRGGYVGYLGYELLHPLQNDAEGRTEEQTLLKGAKSNVPTAAFLFADRSIVVDHQTHQLYVIGLATKDDQENPNAGVSETMEWMERTKTLIQSLSKQTPKHTENLKPTRPPNPINFQPTRPKSTYQQNIHQCHEYIRQGESYELCLTNQLQAQNLTVPVDKTPLDLYRILRTRNPAPYAAYLHFSSHHSNVTLCCSSPERFLSLDSHNILESKPIKGTASRAHHDPALDARIAEELRSCRKNRAENLMIVDLLRNDLGRVCAPGTVTVPKLMNIESFATVHQMVSTIRGTLEDSNDAVDALRAAFPGGSMTGAPKKRSVELLGGLEEGFVRGPYSGALGYVSLNGCMDWNIVIRTAVLTEGEGGVDVSIGAGGAITALSDTDDEYEEMLLKARAVREAVEEWVGCEEEQE